MVFLRQLRPIAQVIAVRMSDENDVHLADLVEVLVLGRRLWILRKPRIDDNDLARHRLDARRRLAEPKHLDLSIRSGGRS